MDENETIDWDAVSAIIGKPRSYAKEEWMKLPNTCQSMSHSDLTRIEVPRRLGGSKAGLRKRQLWASAMMLLTLQCVLENRNRLVDSKN